MSKEFEQQVRELLIREIGDSLSHDQATKYWDVPGSGQKQAEKHYLPLLLPQILKAHTAALEQAYKQGYIAAGVEALKGERHRQPYNSESELDSTTPQLSKYYKEGQ